MDICIDPNNPEQSYRMAQPKSNSAYHGDKIMKILHGNMAETSPALQWHKNPPTACHALAALATSREINAEYWTPRIIDQVDISDLYMF